LSTQSPPATAWASLTRWVATFSAFAGRIELYNFGRWLVLAALTGVVTGVGAAILTWAVDAVTSVAMLRAVGFLPPGYGHPLATVWHSPLRPWLFLLVIPSTGLVVGWLVQKYAPEAEGHGTDAVIRAYHRDRCVIRRRVAPIKLVASALTIGSGGSAGREGPVAQVGAGFASYLSRLLGLSARDRRTLVVAGVAGGIGGMFRAPLGGALFAIEVLYSENEFEAEALVPAIIASIISFVVNNLLTGWETIFHTPPITFTRPEELLAYLLLGIVLALVGFIYVRTFYGLRDGFFNRLPVPAWVRPAVGGAFLAILALSLPQVLGGGYGWLQLTLDGALPLTLLMILVPAKILATALTISSGGSGGVFAPSLIIGGMTGAVFAEAGRHLFPAITPEAAACVLVGMGGFFAGVANVPIASLILVAEMSGSYRLLVPMMLVGSVTVLLTRGVTIYEQQVPGRIDSPAHLGEFEVDILERLSVADALPETPAPTVHPSTPFTEVLEMLTESRDGYFPVVDERGRLVGVFSLDDARAVMATPEVWPALVAADLGVGPGGIGFLLPTDDLHTAVRRFTAFRVAALPVLESAPPSRLLGMVTYQEVLKAYDGAVRHLHEEERTE
jgi:CIC family chloride channel protein